MNDLERIQEIEKVFGFKLNNVQLDKLNSENEFYSISTFKYFPLSSLKEPTFPHKGTRNYSTDSLGNVIGLSLDYSPVISLPINYILGFENLTHLRLKNVALLDYSFLTQMKALKSLTLSNNSLSEVAFLKEMKSLTSLDISFNELTDVSFLEELNGLTTLDLSSNNLSDVSFLKKLEKLSTLHLRSNYLSNISFLEEMQSIRILDLRSNKFSDASFLKRAQNITSLYLSYNKLTDVTFLKDMTGLTSLYISDLGLTDISFLENLKGLKSLHLRENKIKDYSPLKYLKEIKSIDLSKNNLEDKSISFLKEMDSLVSLNLNDTNVSEISFLKVLQSLKFLYLKNNNLSKISFLREMKGITTLDLRNNGIAKEEKEISILKELPELTALDLSMNPLVNYSILKELQGLDLLFLRNNKLEDISFLKDLRKLTILDISYNKISSIAPLKELVNLISLDLRKNNIPNISHLKEMKQLASLDLGINNLSDISSLKDLKAISYLDLSSNKRINYYLSLKELRGLTLLGLEKNEIGDISFLSELKGLKSLDLANNKIIDTLPLKELKSLSSLDLSDNKELNDFSFLLELENLTSLDLSSCEKIDYSILSELHKLTSLGLNKNKIEDTSFLKKIKNLISLNLKSNQITDISFLYEFKYLDFADLSNNKITTLPENITEFNLKLVIDGKEEPSEEAINLKGNPIESPPLEFVRQGIDSIKNYFSQIKNNSKMEYFHESKLFLIGTESKFKNLILDIMNNSDFAQSKENPYAENISILKWDKPVEKKESDINRKEIYDSTHQFFISENSLYLYITKGGNDWNQKDFEIWLELIAKFTGNSLIIFIQIKTNSSEANINITINKELYPNIRLDPYRITTTNNLEFKAENKEELVQFREYIFNTIHERKLFDIVEKIPETHIKIYQEIKELRKNKKCISLQGYFEICKKYLLSESQALSLSGYFHRKGVFLHFQNEIGLKTIIFLNREWITTALFNLFNNEKIKNQFGKFTDDDLREIWKVEDYYALLPLLKNPRFKICFLDKKGFYLIPQLFSNARLTFDLQLAKGSLSYQFKYERMPIGIISQLIISMHEKIQDDNYCRTGILFKDNKSKALVIEDQDRKIISIRTARKQDKDLLSDINKEIRKINNFFGIGKLSVIESVGCNCNQCQKTEKQYFFEKRLIDKYLEKNKKQIVCENSIENVNIDSLGVEIDTANEEDETNFEKNSTTLKNKSGEQDMENKDDAKVIYHITNNTTTNVQGNAENVSTGNNNAITFNKGISELESLIKAITDIKNDNSLSEEERNDNIYNYVDQIKIPTQLLSQIEEEIKLWVGSGYSKLDTSTIKFLQYGKFIFYAFDMAKYNDFGIVIAQSGRAFEREIRHRIYGDGNIMIGDFKKEYNESPKLKKYIEENSHDDLLGFFNSKLEIIKTYRNKGSHSNPEDIIQKDDMEKSMEVFKTFFNEWGVALKFGKFSEPYEIRKRGSSKQS